MNIILIMNMIFLTFIVVGLFSLWRIGKEIQESEKEEELINSENDEN